MVMPSVVNGVSDCNAKEGLERIRRDIEHLADLGVEISWEDYPNGLDWVAGKLVLPDGLDVFEDVVEDYLKVCMKKEYWTAEDAWTAQAAWVALVLYAKTPEQATLMLHKAIEAYNVSGAGSSMGRWAASSAFSYLSSKFAEVFEAKHIEIIERLSGLLDTGVMDEPAAQAPWLGDYATFSNLQLALQKLRVEA